jgi:Subtilase family
MAECGGNRTEGKDGVSLRVPRPVIMTTAIALVAAWAALGSVPASAGQVRQGEWWLGAMHVTQAQQISLGTGVTVALLDTGVDATQPDIAGSVITGPDFTNSSEQPGGQFYGIHGTAMASLIVGHGHGPGDADGILGVAPAAKLLSIRVTLDAGDPLLANSGIVSGLPSAIAAGITYAVNNGAQVIDLPLDPGQSASSLVATPTPAPAPGTPPTPTEAAEQTAAGGSPAEQAAVAYALSKGVVLVAPGGDNGAGTDAANFPADYPGVISVGAFDSNFIKAPFTSRRPYVTLTAAGSGMTAAIPTGYTTVSSTSAASAIVTGIAALIKSQYPELTPAQVTRALTSSTVFRPAGGMTDGSGHGTADAKGALAAAKVIAGPVPRAGAGDVARTQPATPPVPFVDQALAPKIKRDALISGALLVVLLVPVTAYGLARRHRRRARQPARPVHEPTARTPYAHHEAGHADQMLQYFATVPAQPAGSAHAAGSAQAAGTGAGPVAARSSTYARGTGSFGGTFADTGPQPGDDSRIGQLPRSPRPGVTRSTATRPAKVSGSPPWEPASKPDTELPWAASPAPLPKRTPTPLPVPPASTVDSVWNKPADSWQAPAAEAVTTEAVTTEAVTTEGVTTEGGDNGDQPSLRPIYVWNPSVSTETFPSVPARAGEADPPPAEQPPAATDQAPGATN